jgi:hypothetical protein
MRAPGALKTRIEGTSLLYHNDLEKNAASHYEEEGA